MAAVVGYDLTITIDSNELEGCNSVTFPRERDMYDSTNFKDIGSNAVRKYLATLMDGTLSLSGQYDSGTAQSALLTKYGSGADVTVAIDIDGDASDEFTFSAKVTNYTVSAEVGSVVEFSAELQLNGAVT